MPKAKAETKTVGALTVDKAVPTKEINGIEFIEVNEMYRMYEFPNGRQIQIDNVKYVNVSASRGHRLLTTDGRMYYIKPAESWFMVFEKYPYEHNAAFTF